MTGSTLFHTIPESIAINIPTYNFNALELREIKKKRLEEGLKSYKEFSYKRYRKQIEEMFRRINEDWELFMIGVSIADDIGHAFIGNKKVMRKIYRKLNLLAYNVNQAVGDDTLLLIVSDHVCS